jgi:hypothetical protein
MKCPHLKSRIETNDFRPSLKYKIKVCALTGFECECPEAVKKCEVVKCLKCKRNTTIPPLNLCRKCIEKDLAALKALDKRIEESLKVSDESWNRRMTI